MFQIEEGLAFDDVLLKPKYSEVYSRSNVDVSVRMGDFTFAHPIIPANMKNVLNHNMADKIIKSSGLAILHRFDPMEKQLNLVDVLIKDYGSDNIAVSIGIQKEDIENLKLFVKAGIQIICLDVAHSHHKRAGEMVSYIKKTYPKLFIIAGNIATGEGATFLWEAGADAVKIGIGNGSSCSTRIEAGAGVPILSSLIDCAKAKEALIQRDIARSVNRNYYMISDGGVRSGADVCKSLCLSDMVMVGNLFARAKEAPGERIEIDGVKYKEYAGSSTHKTDRVEGVKGLVPISGKYNDILQNLIEGLQSGCSYQGVSNLTDFKKNITFVKISNAGLIESHPHSIKRI